MLRRVIPPSWRAQELLIPAAKLSPSPSFLPTLPRDRLPCVTRGSPAREQRCCARGSRCLSAHKRLAVTSKTSFIAIRSDERCHCSSRCRAGPGLGAPGPGRGSRAAQVSPAPAGERRRPRRHPVAGAHGASAGRARPSAGPPRPLPARCVQPSLLPSLRLIKIGLYAEHL